VKFVEVGQYSPTPVNYAGSGADYKLRRHYRYHFLASGDWTLLGFSQALPEVLAWCEANVKRRKLWHHEGIRIMFRNPNDALAFKMRWC
jgi:hypothetical protein